MNDDYRTTTSSIQICESMLTHLRGVHTGTAHIPDSARRRFFSRDSPSESHMKHGQQGTLFGESLDQKSRGCSEHASAVRR